MTEIYKYQTFRYDSNYNEPYPKNARYLEPYEKYNNKREYELKFEVIPNNNRGYDFLATYDKFDFQNLI